MANKPHLSIVRGTEAPLPRYVDPGPSTRYVATSVVNEHGNPYLKDAGVPEVGHGGGGGSVKLTLPDLRWNVAILNGLAGLFFVGLLAMWLWMVDRIDDKFEVADNRNREIAKDVSEIKQSVAGQNASLQIIIQRLGNDDPQTGTRSGQTEPIRKGP